METSEKFQTVLSWLSNLQWNKENSMPTKNDHNAERSSLQMNGKNVTDQTIGFYQASSETDYAGNQNHSKNSNNYSLLMKNIKSIVPKDTNGLPNKHTMQKKTSQMDEYSVVWEKVIKMSELECKLNRVAATYECNAIQQNSGGLNSWAAVMTIADQPNQIIGTFGSSLEAIRRATCAAIIMESNVAIQAKDDNIQRDTITKHDNFTHSKSLEASPSSRSSSPDPPLADLIRGGFRKNSLNFDTNTNTSFLSRDPPLVDLIQGKQVYMNLKKNQESTLVPTSVHVDQTTKVQTHSMGKLPSPSIPYAHLASRQQSSLKLLHENERISVNGEDDQDEEIEDSIVNVATVMDPSSTTEKAPAIQSTTHGYGLKPSSSEIRFTQAQLNSKSRQNYVDASQSIVNTSVQDINLGLNKSGFRKGLPIARNGMKFPPFTTPASVPGMKMPLENSNKLKSSPDPNTIAMVPNKKEDSDSKTITYERSDMNTGNGRPEHGNKMAVTPFTNNANSKILKNSNKLALLQLLRNSYPCEMSDPKTNQVVDVFFSSVQAQAETGLSYKSIALACRKGGAVSAGRFWRYLSKEELFLFLERVKVEGTRYAIAKSYQFHQLLSEYSSLSGRDEQVRPPLMANPIIPSQAKRKISSISSTKCNEFSDEDFDASTLLPLNPQKVSKRVKKYVELVDNKSKEVLVCFRGNLDAGKALGLDRKKVGRACQSYGAPFEIKFKGYHLRYKKAGQPLEAYEYGKHKEDFMYLNEKHEERLQRWRKMFIEDLKSPPKRLYQQNLESVYERRKNERTTSPSDTEIDVKHPKVNHSTPENKYGDISRKKNNNKIQHQLIIEKEVPANTVGQPSLNGPKLPQSHLNAYKRAQTLGTSHLNNTLGHIGNDETATGHVPVIRQVQEIDVTYGPDEIAVKNIIDQGKTKSAHKNGAGNPAINLHSKSKITTHLHPSTPLTYQNPPTRHKYDNLCLICQKKTASVVFHPCHHTVICSSCDRQGIYFPKFCPTCRMEIHDRVLSKFAVFARPRIYSAYSFM